MYKIVGKIYVLLLLHFWVITSVAGIRLEVKTFDGIPSNTAVVGQPFIAEVTIDGVQGSVQGLQIKGLENILYERTGVYMSSVNGSSTSKYTYQIRIDRPGEYTIGPAVCVHQQQQLSSSAVSVTVENGSHVTSKATKKDKKSDLKAFLRLNVDAEQVVVGQKINTSLRLYYQDSSLSLVNIMQPDIVGFNIKSHDNTIGGTADVNGVHYRYAEWQWEMFPKSPGEFVIPAYSIDYEVPLKSNHVFGGIFSILGSRVDRKRIYSNSVSITVDPLPDCNMHVDAVGVFENITAHITPAVAKEGEGMVLVLEITGKGNLEAIPSPKLIIPNELKYYDSHVSIIPAIGDQLPSKKRFEFIVQGMKSGDWEIPEQSFSFYDIEKNAYATLKTSPLSVTIQPLPSKTLITDNQTVQQSELKKQAKDSHIAPLNGIGPWYPVTERDPIPWALFCCIFCLPMMYITYPRITNGLLGFNTIARMYKKIMIYRARRRIMKCNDDVLIHGIFMELYSFLMEKPVSTLSKKCIEKYLKECRFTQQEVAEWRLFFDKSACAAYAQSHKNNIHDLLGVAIQWLERLQEAI